LVNKHKKTTINPYIHSISGIFLFLSVFLYIAGKFSVFGKLFFSFYLIYIVGTLIFELYTQNKNTIDRLACIFFGQAYIALPFSALNLLAFPHSAENAPSYQWIWIIALFIFIWVNDSGAYLIGINFGKNRLWERISPKKSWEGFFGGFVFSIIAAIGFAHFYPQTAWYHWIALSIAVVILSTYGDLVESMIKRALGVKDSGKSLPGHGGFLDRFDSLLLAVYVMVVYLQLFIQN
jgi:phosphatidate cytidylyltransferase